MASPHRDFPSSPLDWAAVLSCIRPGPDTKAARLLKDLANGSPPAPDSLPRLLDALQIPDPQRAHMAAVAQTTARKALERAAKRQIGLLPYFAEAYPALLRAIPDPPVVLWTEGDSALASRPAVAIVGARQASPAGLDIARRLASDLAAAALVIVSGMARGVDAAAHLGALEQGAGTIAVLGCGTDVVYPSEHATLAERIRQTGLVVSELLPGTPPLPYHFPLRNRIISGLSRAVIVIEASERSGSLITARAALDQNRDVLAVPGTVTSGRSKGCHALIKDGARLVETVEDVLQELNWRRPGSETIQGRKTSVLSVLEASMDAGEPYSVDDLAARSGRDTPGLLAELGALELAGRVQRTEGGRFVRLD